MCSLRLLASLFEVGRRALDCLPFPPPRCVCTACATDPVGRRLLSLLWCTHSARVNTVLSRDGVRVSPVSWGDTTLPPHFLFVWVGGPFPETWGGRASSPSLPLRALRWALVTLFGDCSPEGRGVPAVMCSRVAWACGAPVWRGFCRFPAAFSVDADALLHVCGWLISAACQPLPPRSFLGW